MIKLYLAWTGGSKYYASDCQYMSFEITIPGARFPFDPESPLMPQDEKFIPIPDNNKEIGCLGSFSIAQVRAIEIKIYYCEPAQSTPSRTLNLSTGAIRTETRLVRHEAILDVKPCELVDNQVYTLNVNGSDAKFSTGRTKLVPTQRPALAAKQPEPSTTKSILQRILHAMQNIWQKVIKLFSWLRTQVKNCFTKHKASNEPKSTPTVVASVISSGDVPPAAPRVETAAAKDTSSTTTLSLLLPGGTEATSEARDRMRPAG